MVGGAGMLGIVIDGSVVDGSGNVGSVVDGVGSEIDGVVGGAGNDGSVVDGAGIGVIAGIGGSGGSVSGFSAGIGGSVSGCSAGSGAIAGNPGCADVEPGSELSSSGVTAAEVSPVGAAEISSLELEQPLSMSPMTTPTIFNETRVTESMSSYLLFGSVLHAQGRHRS